MTSATSARLTLNNGVEMPALGLGVFQSPPAETAGAVEAAIGVGYRLIDTAAAYMNEREVGEGIRRSGIARRDLFLVTKVWITDYGYDATLHAFDKSAGKLTVDELDLLLLHQPLGTAFDRTVDAYRALERLLADRKVRAIVRAFDPHPTHPDAAGELLAAVVELLRPRASVRGLQPADAGDVRRGAGPLYGVLRRSRRRARAGPCRAAAGRGVHRARVRDPQVDDGVR